MERALQTATPISKCKNLPITIADELNELDYGAWTGYTLESLATNPHWNDFNVQRCNVTIPSGETIIEVQSRMIQLIASVIEQDLSAIAIVSHADPIKAVIAHFIGIPINYTINLEISPASITMLTINKNSVMLEFCNKQV
jgi:probable phosphoglycerate mutase